MQYFFNKLVPLCYPGLWRWRRGRLYPTAQRQRIFRCTEDVFAIWTRRGFAKPTAWWSGVRKWPQSSQKISEEHQRNPGTLPTKQSRVWTGCVAEQKSWLKIFNLHVVFFPRLEDNFFSADMLSSISKQTKNVSDHDSELSKFLLQSARENDMIKKKILMAELEAAISRKEAMEALRDKHRHELAVAKKQAGWSISIIIVW